MPLVFVDLLQSTGTKGGIEVYVRELYRHIGELDSGFDFVGFASRELATQDVSWFPGRVVDSGISGENRLSWARGEVLSVGRAAARLGADLVHGPAMFGPWRSQMPVVISFHDLLYFSHPHLMQTKLFTEPVKLMERRGAANATRIITISEYSASAIRRYLRFPADRIDVIPLAARPSAVSGVDATGRVDDLFLSIGQRSPYKDFETVIEAWALIPEASRPRLVVTGSHGDDPLAPLVRRLGLERHVQLREWVSTEELSTLLGTATALIDSTLASGFSLPTLEAMSVGLPVILADTEIFREVGRDAAEYFAPGDPHDLARAVSGLDADRRERLAARGRTIAAGSSWGEVARQTLATFESALRHPRR